MKIVMPISHVDIEQAKLLAKQLVTFGMDKKVIVVSTWRATWDIDALVELLGNSFLECVSLQSECEVGWPESSNHLFYESATFLQKINNDEPWLFMEADMFPIMSSWYGDLLDEYNSAGKPYMGVIGANVYVNKLTGKTWIDGKHMVGAGIYPADFLQRCKSVHYLDYYPWDIAISSEIIKEVHHTNLIAHRWNTCNYRYDNSGDFIIMDDIPKEFVGPRAKPIPLETVLVHGVKDSSLYNLLNPANSVAS